MSLVLCRHGLRNPNPERFARAELLLLIFITACHLKTLFDTQKHQPGVHSRPEKSLRRPISRYSMLTMGVIFTLVLITVTIYTVGCAHGFWKYLKELVSLKDLVAMPFVSWLSPTNIWRSTAFGIMGSIHSELWINMSHYAGRQFRSFHATRTFFFRLIQAMAIATSTSGSASIIGKGWLERERKGARN